MLLKKLTLSLGIVALSTVAFGQKTKVTDAALEYGKLKPMLYAGTDIPGAKKSVIIAKNSIDEASNEYDAMADKNVAAEPKDLQKMNWYKGEIYFALSILIGMDSTIIDMSSDDALDVSMKSWKTGMGQGNKYAEDIDGSVKEKISMIYMFSGEFWKKEEYQNAGEGYEACALLSDCLGTLDTLMIFNAGLSYENAKNYEKAAEMYSQLAKANYRGAKGAVLAANVYRRLEQNDKVIEILSVAQSSYPNDRELLLALVNANIDAGNASGAEAALKAAIATDPTNAKLHYNSGTIYIELKENQKAEEALRKALELDPGYTDAQYQLGAHLYNWAFQLKDEAAFLKIGDPKEEELKAQSDEKMKGSIDALETYIKSDPNDKNVLQILYKAYHKQGNSEKASEYKKRYDAL